ncbi:hypothetical protein BLA29_007003, partial [Euroglyphus maynei]
MSPQQILTVKRPPLMAITRRSPHDQNQFNSMIEITNHQGSSTPPQQQPTTSSTTTSATMVTSLPSLSMKKSTAATSKTMVKKRSKSAFRCRFFVNGDRHFIGIYYVINIDRLRTLDSLCRELSRILVNV